MISSGSAIPRRSGGSGSIRGFSLIQTDETLVAIDYLNTSGARFELGLNDVFGSQDGDRLSGSAAADVLRPGAGRLDRMSGGDGADVFVFGAETANGSRETDIITDYVAGQDTIDLGGTGIAATREMTGRLRLELEGDGDILWVYGVDSFDEITFA